MRFVLLMIGAAATSALSVAGVRTMLAPTGQTVQSAPARGGDQASMKPGGQPGDFDPVSAADDSVARQTTSGGVDAPQARPGQRMVTVGPTSLGASGPVTYLGGGPVVRTWGWDHWHVHHDMPAAREFVHHELPPARVHHDTPPAREFHPVAPRAAVVHSGGSGHGGGHGRR